MEKSQISRKTATTEPKEITAEDVLLFFRKNPQSMTAELRNAIAKFSVLQDGANRIINSANKAELKENYQDWKNIFLQSRKSDKTRRAYKDAIAKLELFCESEKIDPTELNYFYADKFLQSPFLRIGANGKERADSSKKLDIAGISSFYSKMYRYSNSKIANPFIGIERPQPSDRQHLKQVPTDAELQTILKETNGIINAAIFAMAERGFRIGALQNLYLTTRNGQTNFETRTKGKTQKGILSDAVLNAIQKNGLPKIKPFASISTMNLTKRIERKLAELFAEGKIQNRYSCHSFRHYFATKHYTQNKDIEALRKLLNHTSIATTQIYLQSLGVLN